MRKIYIVLTYTGTLLAKLVKIYTRKEYSHVSLSLDEDLSHMYSFGRLNPYNPFIGGFVQESPHYGTFKRFHKTKTKIYSIEVEDDQYESVKSLIEDIWNHKEIYRFNFIGLCAVAFHLKIKREKCFYCAEFVKYVLEQSELNLNLPELIKPNDFASINGVKEVYNGILKEYNL